MSQLKQAAVIISAAWQRQLTYRFTILMFRLGEIVETLVLIFMWSAIYAAGATLIKGFTLDEMITYVLVGTICATTARNFVPSYVARDIIEGRLSMFLVKPISYVKFIFVNEIGRAGLSTLLSLLTLVAVTLFFLDRIVMAASVLHLLVIVAMVVLAVVVELLIGFLVGAVAFWTDEVDGVHNTIDRVKRFFSGGYFPLALLPAGVLAVSSFFPFQYLFFAPASLWIGKMTVAEGLFGLGVQVVWIVLLSLLVRVVWKAGLKRYEASGS